jgi:hypothetical protein
MYLVLISYDVLFFHYFFLSICSHVVYFFCNMWRFVCPIYTHIHFPYVFNLVPCTQLVFYVRLFRFSLLPAFPMLPCSYHISHVIYGGGVVRGCVLLRAIVSNIVWACFPNCNMYDFIIRSNMWLCVPENLLFICRACELKLDIWNPSSVFSDSCFLWCVLIPLFGVVCVLCRVCCVYFEFCLYVLMAQIWFYIGHKNYRLSQNYYYLN